MLALIQISSLIIKILIIWHSLIIFSNCFLCFDGGEKSSPSFKEQSMVQLPQQKQQSESQSQQQAQQQYSNSNNIQFNINDNLNNNINNRKQQLQRFDALKIPPCHVGYFECDSGDFCVRQQYNCDHIKDCPDGSDESNCTDKDDSSYYNKLFSKRPDEDREKLQINCLFQNDSVPSNCSCSGRSVFCVKQNLYSIPTSLLPSKLNTLDLSGNHIARIDQTSFTRRLKNLKSLIMTSNNISWIDQDAFKNLTELTHLHLIGNQLKEIVDHIFRKNKKLLLLNLSYNPIKIIGPNAFDGLNELIELDLRACQLIELPAKIFGTLKHLELLWLQQNQITTIYEDAFINLNRLDTLSLAHNQLKILNETIFMDLTGLKSLSLAYNQLTYISDQQLNPMTSLSKLDLSFNKIETIGSMAFRRLHKLRSLALQGNRFKKLSPNTFSELQNLTHIYFSNFRMCTYALKVRVCMPHGDGISSVQHLLDNFILRVAVWIVAMIAMFGNCLVIIGRMIMHELNVVHSFFIKNLAMADLLMGIYLLIIAYHDMKFRNHYIIHEEEWRLSWQCTFAGVISTISSEASVFILAIITIDRYISVMHPFSIKRHSMMFALVAMLAVWLMSSILALMPLIADRYFTNRFYGNNGVCLGLQIHDTTGLDYSTFLFCGLNSAAFIFILYAYVKMSMTIMNSATGLRTTQLQRDRNIAKRCAFIVATDGICWLPIVLIKLAAVSGIAVNQDLYAWVAVFLLPVNSALNPVLYTLTTKLFKQQINKIITHNFSSTNRHTPTVMDQSSSSICSLNFQKDTPREEEKKKHHHHHINIVSLMNLHISHNNNGQSRPNNHQHTHHQHGHHHKRSLCSGRWISSSFKNRSIETVGLDDLTTTTQQQQQPQGTNICDDPNNNNKKNVNNDEFSQDNNYELNFKKRDSFL